jgi:hypothetical protein
LLIVGVVVAVVGLLVSLFVKSCSRLMTSFSILGFAKINFFEDLMILLNLISIRRL